ncbi:MAG: glutamine amidotransferase [Thalassovita sp.]
MSKPFLILQLRPETEASDDEYQAFLDKGGLSRDDTHRIRLDQEDLPALDFSNYSGVIVGGGPGCVSDPVATKDPIEARIEAQILAAMPQITDNDVPFLGCCYGIGILGHHLNGDVSKERYGEDVGPSHCTQTEAGRGDPLLEGLPESFHAFVGHKEALQSLPAGVTQLLSSDPCPFQMIKYKQNIYATQFHPEADGAGFELRIRLYKSKGYFPPEDADRLIDLCRSAQVDQPEKILRNFVQRYQTEA